MDGFETIKAIKQKEKYNHIPIIALTALAKKEDMEKCINYGCNDYMSKPVKINLLLKMINKWLKTNDYYIKKKKHI